MRDTLFYSFLFGENIFAGNFLSELFQFLEF